MDKLEEGIKTLLDLGKRRGFLTFDQVNDLLPDDATSPDRIHSRTDLVVEDCIGNGPHARFGAPGIRGQENLIQTVRLVAAGIRLAGAVTAHRDDHQIAGPACGGQIRKRREDGRPRGKAQVRASR